MAVELIERRGKTVKVFNVNKNEYEMQFFSYPIHYLTEDGRWEEINTEIKPISEWEFTNGVTSNSFRAYFGDSTKENNHLLGYEIIDNGTQRWINLKLKDASPSLITTKDNTITFHECFDGVDFEYIVTSEMLKENIIINNPTNIREFIFTIKQDGCHIKINEDGGVSFVRDDTDEVISTLNTPYMIDSLGNVSYGVTYKLGNDGNFDTLSVLIDDEDFMKNTENYPIVVDPSIIIVDDYSSVIHANYYDPNFGSNNPTRWSYNTLDWIGMAGRYGYHQSVIYFRGIDKLKEDIKTYGDRVKILDAELSVYGIEGNDTIAVGKITDKWDIDLPPVFVDNINPISNRSKAILQYIRERMFTTITSPLHAWRTINLKDVIDLDFYGVGFTAYGSSSYDVGRLASPTHSNFDYRPKLTVKYTVTPTLLFHDGTGDKGAYSDNKGQPFKYLDFGAIQAGMIATPQKVYLRNYSGEDVKNVEVKVITPMSEDVKVEISKTQNPFVPEDVLYFDGILADNEDVTFFVRVVTQENAKYGGVYQLKARADIVR